ESPVPSAAPPGWPSRAWVDRAHRQESRSLAGLGSASARNGLEAQRQSAECLEGLDVEVDAEGGGARLRREDEVAALREDAEVAREHERDPRPKVTAELGRGFREPLPDCRRVQLHPRDDQTRASPDVWLQATRGNLLVG